MGIYESGENYLETILLLQSKNGFVRSIDIAEELRYSKPSISRAMGVLRENGYIEMSPDGSILLTDKGKDKAEAIYERHRVIKDYLVLELCVKEEIADTDACKIEHFLSDDVILAMKHKIKISNLQHPTSIPETR